MRDIESMVFGDRFLVTGRIPGICVIWTDILSYFKRNFTIKKHIAYVWPFVSCVRYVTA